MGWMTFWWNWYDFDTTTDKLSSPKHPTWYDHLRMNSYSICSTRTTDGNVSSLSVNKMQDQILRWVFNFLRNSCEKTLQSNRNPDQQWGSWGFCQRSSTYVCKHERLSWAHEPFSRINFVSYYFNVIRYPFFNSVPCHVTMTNSKELYG